MVVALLGLAMLMLTACWGDDDADEEVHTGDESSASSGGEDESVLGPEEPEDSSEGQGGESAETGAPGDELGITVYEVQPGDTMIEIVRRQCPDSMDLGLVTAVYLANRDAEQPDGGRLTDINRIEIGWQLVIDCELAPVVEERGAGECLDGYELVYAGRTVTFENGQLRDVTICADGDGAGDFHAADQFGGQSIRFPMCRQDDRLVAVHQGWTFTVEPGSVYERADPEGEIRTLAFTENDELGTGRVDECKPEPVVYPIVPLTTNRMALAGSGEASSYPHPPDCLASRPEAARVLGASELEPEAPLYVQQGGILSFTTSFERELAVVGGGHRWDLRAFTQDGTSWYTLDIGTEHPVGRYTLDGLPDRLATDVIIEPSRQLLIRYDGESEEAVRFIVYGGAGGFELDVFRLSFPDCQRQWRIWQSGATLRVNEEGNARVIFDRSDLPEGRYCFIPSGRARDCTRAGEFSGPID